MTHVVCSLLETNTSAGFISRAQIVACQKSAKYSFFYLKLKECFEKQRSFVFFNQGYME
jgi:hypothetical protein